MKKRMLFFMGLALILGVAACNNADASGTTASSAAETSQEEVSQERDTKKETAQEVSQEGDTKKETAQEENSEAESLLTETGKILVVFYSATGNTGKVADFIVEATNGDVFELEPVEPYSSADLNWTDDSSRVVYEHDNPNERDVELVSVKVPDWESYDTVFIGYPIWWGIAAWPVDGFVKANDFTGKTVIPFCTSSSSGLGESGELLAELAGTGDWLEGMRFSSGVSEEKVVEWLESLDL